MSEEIEKSCETCKHEDLADYELICVDCHDNHYCGNWEPKEEFSCDYFGRPDEYLNCGGLMHCPIYDACTKIALQNEKVKSGETPPCFGLLTCSDDELQSCKFFNKCRNRYALTIQRERIKKEGSCLTAPKETITRKIPKLVMALEACGDKIIVLPDDVETETSFGLIIVQGAEEPIEFGWVISEGPGCKQCWKGRYIWFGRWLGSKAKIHGQEIRVFDEDSNSPLAIVETDKVLELTSYEPEESDKTVETRDF